MSRILVETHNLTKRYKKFTAVDGLDLNLHEGEVYGFLGPNGSGKSTTILMLLGLTEPSDGQAFVCGVDPNRNPLAVKRQVGYLPENVGFYADLSGRDNLLYTASLNNMPRPQAIDRVRELLSMVELTNATDQMVGQYSRGMRQRLGLADVLLKDPRMIILDDPTLGLDPAGIQWLLELIEEMSSKRNITIFLSSHSLHEVQRICHRVGIMSHGKMVLEGTLSELMADSDRDGFSVELEVTGRKGNIKAAMALLPDVLGYRTEGSRLVVTSRKDIRQPLIEALVGQKIGVLEVRSQNRTLEDIYLRYFQGA